MTITVILHISTCFIILAVTECLTLSPKPHSDSPDGFNVLFSNYIVLI